MLLAGQGRAGTESSVSMRSHRFGSALLLPLFLTACSQSNFSTGHIDVSDTAVSGDYETGQYMPDAEDSGIVVEPMWWRLSAALSLKQGAPLAAKNALTIELLGSKDESLCVRELSLQSAEDWPLDSASVLAAWKLTPEPADILCGLYETPLDESIVLGIGEMHPDIQAAIGAIASLDAEAPLNGAYMVTLDQPEVIYVYGVSGLVSAYAGEGEIASQLPLEDGSWLLEPVYRFSY